MSVDHPPKSLVWKDRPKSRKVSKIRTVSTVHRTTRLGPPTEDTTSDTAPQPNVGDTTSAVEEEQALPEPPETARKRAKLPWPHGSGLPGFGAYTGKMWYNSDSEEADEHDDPPLPATTSNTRSFPVPKYRDRHLEPEPSSDSKLPGPIKYDKSPGGDREHLGTGKIR
jgi:hypothetical protein